MFRLTNVSCSAIRGKIREDYQHIFSVYDFINVVCEKDVKSNYGRTVFGRLTADGSEFKKELDNLCFHVKFTGHGYRDTPAMTIRGFQRLLLILGGKVAQEFRALVETTFSRVMAGDRSMIDVIESNNKSNGAIQQAYRAGLEHDPSPGDGPDDHLLDTITGKRNWEEMEKSVSLGREYEQSLERSTGYLREAIVLRKELNILEIEQEKNKISVADEARAKELEFNCKKYAQELEHERVKMALAEENRAKILAFERTKRQIVSNPVLRTEPVVIAPVQVREPTITVQNVYLKNKAQFPKITKKQEGPLLSNAGKAAKDAYKTKHGELPSSKDENGQFMVAAYPVTEESMIMEALVDAYRKLLAGSTPTLQKFFLIPTN